MTKEEAIKELEEIAEMTIWNYRRLAVNMAIEALQQTAWIPVVDKLPEIGKRVLVYVMGDKALLCFHEVRDSYIGIYMGDGRWGVWIYDGMRLLDSEDVLAWTPLPKPYKKGQ